jgi:8-oxo-dGTP diphosphatase
MKEYVAGFVFCNHDVALVLKNKPNWQKGLWNGIGGKIEPGEFAKEAMIREFFEETGNKFECWREMVILTDMRGWKVHFFGLFIESMADINLPAKNDRDEILRWHGIDDFPDNCIHNLHWLIPFCFHQKIVRPVEVIEPQRL